MIKHTLFLIFILCVSFAGCLQNSPQPGAKDSTINNTSTPHEQAFVENTPQYPIAKVENDTLVIFKFGPNDTAAIATANIEYLGKNKHVTCLVQVNKANKLEAELIPEQDTANIRFSQIFMPDGSSDGPFDRKLFYKLKKKGTYKLMIGENMMAGDEWKGKLKISVRLIR